MHVILFITITLVVPKFCWACTGFYLNAKTGYVCTRSFDWPEGQGLILVNKRGIKKTAMIGFVSGQVPVEWVSKFGSVTFNQAGCDLPNFGVNEAGLVVQGFIFNRSEYPRKDSRLIIGQAQWKQYLLDNCSSIEGVINTCYKIRINSPTGQFGQHYFICDKFGDSVTIEFIAGETIIHAYDDIVIKALVDTSTYSECLDFLKLHEGFGGNKAVPTGPQGLDRFVRAANWINRFQEKRSEIIDYSFKILDDVEIGGYTKWQIVYNSNAQTIHYRTSKNKNFRIINFAELDYSCEQPILFVDLDSVSLGVINNHLVPFTSAANADLLSKSEKFSTLPENIKKKISEYPASFKCLIPTVGNIN
jgi:choloylglycine hydrolase